MLDFLLKASPLRARERGPQPTAWKGNSAKSINPNLLEGVLGDAALSGEAAAQQAAEAYRECTTGL